MLKKITSALGSIAIDGFALGIVVLDRHYNVILWSQWMEKHSGIKARDIIGENIIDRYPDIRDRKQDRYIIECIENQRTSLLSPFLHNHLIPLNIVKGDEMIPMLQNVKIIPFFEAEEIPGAIIIIEDLTEQILHEKEIVRLNRVLKGIRNVNQLITRVESENELLSDSCKILVETVRYVAAWAGLIEEGSFDVKPIAFAGIEPETFNELKVKWDESEYGLGATGTAIRTGEAQIVDWIQKDPSSKPWWEWANRIGYQSTCSLPLKVDGSVIGALNIHSRERNVFHGEELKLLEEVTADISFGITTLRERQKRRKAEEALAVEKERLSVTLRSIGDGLISTDVETRVMLINDVAEELIGWNQEEAVGKPLNEVFHIINEETRERCENPVEKVMATGKIVGLANDTVLIARDGTERALADSSAPIYDYEGKIIGVVLVFRDITERKKSEQDRERLFKAIEIAKEAVSIQSSDLITLYENDAMANLFGYEKGELIGKHVSILDTDATSEATLRQIVKGIEKDGYWEGEVHNKRKDGSEFLTYAAITAIKDRDGKIINFISTQHDITERRQAQEALRESERELRIRNRIAEIFLRFPDDEMYRDVLKVVLEAMESPYGTFAYINEDGDRIVPSMTRDIWGECKMRDKDIFFPRGTWGDVLWARCIIEKKSFSSNGPFKVPKGHIPIKRALATPIIYKGEVIGNLMVGDKLTDYDDKDKKMSETISDHIAPILHARLRNEIHEKKRKKAEEMLQRAHKELERRVEERTEDLLKANALLNQEITQHKKSQEILKRSETELRKLSSKILSAHEEESRRIGQELHDGLAQTLIAIKTWVENIRVQMEHKNTAEVAKSFERILPLTQGAVEEVRRISMNLRPSILDDLGIVPTISWLCRDFETIYPGIVIEKQIGIEENDVPESLKSVIFRVLQEALNNIAKHSQANLVRISLKRGESTLELTINDNGVGFDVNLVTVKPQFDRGLGLASMKERATLSGGCFLIESQKGEGTTIHVSWRCDE